MARVQTLSFLVLSKPATRPTKAIRQKKRQKKGDSRLHGRLHRGEWRKDMDCALRRSTPGQQRVEGGSQSQLARVQSTGSVYIGFVNDRPSHLHSTSAVAMAHERTIALSTQCPFYCTSNPCMKSPAVLRTRPKDTRFAACSRQTPLRRTAAF